MFTGELLRRSLLPETVILSVFDLLIAFETKEALISDITVEGAVILAEKIGYLIDKRLVSSEP